jgi:hypothetical protein
MMLRPFVLVAALVISGVAHAQTQAPSASDSDAPPANSAAKAAKPKPKRTPNADDQAAADRKDKATDEKKGEGGVASIIGKTLRLNGSSGAMEIAKGDSKEQPLKIVTLKLSGEVVSNPQQKCEISIVAGGPIAASHEGAPDGLPRFSADIPACPLSFDAVDGGVIVPPQTRACVFQAADCQASPSGVWGLDPAALAPLSRTLAKDRTRAEASIAESLKTLAKRSKGEDSELQKEQSDFNALRDETCRDYADESTHGFCDARMTQARAALLRKQVAKAPPKKDEEKKEKKKKKEKTETTE